MTEEIKIPCEVFSRIVGYLSAVQFWHKGKQAEYAERVPFKVPGLPPPLQPPSPDAAD